LKEYDYSQSGAYFVTICLQNKACLFGKISDSTMILNEAGQMITKWYDELRSKFKDIVPREFVIMPNHFHAIIVHTGPVGADLRVCPCLCPPRDEHAEYVEWGERGEHAEEEGEHAGSPLPTVVQWFKTMTTNEYIRGVKQNGWQPFAGKLWQRNYYEHIIRDENDYRRIANYIVNNPMNWRNNSLWINQNFTPPTSSTATSPLSPPCSPTPLPKQS
jgi:REP element-mobilizing transposase RayT